MKVTAIDFETANRSPASVCALGVSVMEDGVVEERYYSLIRPEEDVFYFDPWNTKVHGIRARDVLDAPDFATVYRHLKKETDGAIVAAHNAAFDMNCLKQACINTGIEVPELRYFDTVELSRKMFRDMPHHRLNDMCSRLDIQLNHHHAGSDAMGCLMIVARVMEMTGIWDIEDLLEQTHTRIRELKP